MDQYHLETREINYSSAMEPNFTYIKFAVSDFFCTNINY